jgi:hypothetical protein
MSNFLDDQLYTTVKNTGINNIDEFSKMMNNLFILCENKYKSELKSGISKQEAKAIIDRVFNYWDLFIKRLEKENYFLIKSIKSNSFKDAFMNNELAKSEYDKL